MKIQRIILPVLVATSLFTACNSDDDKNDPEEVLLSQEEQNQVDDDAISLLLKDYYLNDQGKLTAFSDADPSDDNKTPLADIAVYHDMGYWTVKKQDYTSEGRKVADPEKDSILLQYEMFTYKGKINKAKDSVSYATPQRFLSTINTTGYPSWDPTFYFKKITKEQEEAKITKSMYEIEAFQEGTKFFNSADKNMTDTPFVNFQGLIIIPSRLAFGRERNAMGVNIDQSIIVNFELYKVIDRK
ncbi:MAG: hypothetical protein ACR2MS_00130 [Weeksellaceae bacterium]